VEPPYACASLEIAQANRARLIEYGVFARQPRHTHLGLAIGEERIAREERLASEERRMKVESDTPALPMREHLLLALALLRL